MVDQTILRPNHAVKEHQIAVDVLGRGENFDSRLDAIVRVQAGRLRHKLQEYYSGPGASDPLVIELPRGAYTLNITAHESPAPGDGKEDSRSPETLKALPATPPEAETHRRPGITIRFWVGGTLLALALVAVAGPWNPWSRGHAALNGSPPSLTAVWSNFFNAQEAPIVVFSNAEFVGDPESGLRYFNSATDSRRSVFDHYTGVGEVTAIYELTRLFASVNKDIRVKRARLLSVDDARSANVVFVGSTAENQVLRVLPLQQDFAFQHLTGAEGRRALAIVNLKPGPREFTSLFASATLPIQEDYAIVSLLPGLSPGRWIMLLAGTTTLGTQAAVEFACRPDTTRQLIERTGGARLDRPMEAVIRTEVRGGVPVRNQLVAVHLH